MDEQIIINFIGAYQRKELDLGRRIPYTEASRESGVPYGTLMDYIHGRSRTVSLGNVLRLMDWLGTNDFNHMFERRRNEQPTPTKEKK